MRTVSYLSSYKIDKDIVNLLHKEICNRNYNRSIMLYLPLSGEVNLYPLIQKLRKKQKAIFVPFMDGKSFRLVKYRLPLKRKQFNIKEPKDSRQYRTKKIDISIVPIVGLDSTLRRIGFGKGMYDRFFEKESKNIGETIFIARKLCYSKEVITNHYDIKADKVIIQKDNNVRVNRNLQYNRSSYRGRYMLHMDKI